jgi:hypothetical protein
MCAVHKELGFMFIKTLLHNSVLTLSHGGKHVLVFLLRS